MAKTVLIGVDNSNVQGPSTPPSPIQSRLKVVAGSAPMGVCGAAQECLKAVDFALEHFPGRATHASLSLCLHAVSYKQAHVLKCLLTLSTLSLHRCTVACC